MATETERWEALTAGVEAPSILANKQKTKQFLTSRIQADIEASSHSSTHRSSHSPSHSPRGSHSPASPSGSGRSSHSGGGGSDAARPSRMSAPGPLCPPPGLDAPSVGRAAPPEARIAREIHEQHRREEELRQLRGCSAGDASPGHEEPLSGYGSEDKDSLAEEADSSGLGSGSPVGARRGALPLSRSQESLSSGHSSGLGSDRAAETAARRRVTVRPLEDPDDAGQWPSFAGSGETPIEREIRLTKEREEERRREQALRAAPQGNAGTAAKQQNARQGAAARRTAVSSDRREAALRLATGRVQDEIQEATRRELELRKEGKHITTSEETVDEKVTRLGEMTRQSMEDTSSRRQKPAAPARPQPTSSRPRVTKSALHAPRPAAPPVAAPAAPPSVAPAAPPARPATFRPAPQAGAGRGLMARFISSRGKLHSVSAFAPPVASQARGRSPPRGRRPAPGAPQRRLQTSVSLDNPAQSPGPLKLQVDRRGSGPPANRRLLTAEEKIQLELKTMKEREDELRRERSWALARSQPDLLAALEASDSEEEEPAPPPGALARTMSNPSLIDPQEQMSGGRRRSVLIDQWESRIQGAET